MDDRRLKAYLFDINTAIDEIYSFSNTRPIVATRNRVIHDYAAVTDDVIWR